MSKCQRDRGSSTYVRSYVVAAVIELSLILFIRRRGSVEEEEVYVQVLKVKKENSEREERAG